ncbi:MAG: hypothetical protein R6U88_05485 [Candidatus Bipolaricaulota bacterium]
MVVDGVHAEVAGLSLRIRAPTLADGHLLGVGLVDGQTVLPVGVRSAQPGQVCHGDLTELCALLPAVHFVLPPEDRLGCGAGQPVVCVVHLGKQCLIRTAVLSGEPVALVLRELHMPRAPYWAMRRLSRAWE